MKNILIYHKIILSGILLVFLLTVAFSTHAQGSPGLYLYVWDFGTRDGKKTELTNNFTTEFEEALIRVQCCVILERRNYAGLMSQKDNEQAIMATEGISEFSLKNLKTLEASGVIFGEIYDDVQSGEIKITAIVQAFNGQKLVESVRFSRGRQFDAASREKSMQELAEKVCASLLKPKLSAPTPTLTPPLISAPTLTPKPRPTFTGTSPSSDLLVKAVRANDRGKVNELLKQGVAVNVKDTNDRTALIEAAKCGYPDIVQVLLDADADVHVTEYHTEMTALMYAAKEGYLDIVNMLLTHGANVNAKSSYSVTSVLTWAVESNNFEIVKLLLEKGADVKHRYSRQALAIGARNGNIEIVNILLEKGADVNVEASNYDPALIEAVKSHSIKIVELLLEKRADINIRNSSGETALVKAVESHNIKIIKLLLEKGANVDARDNTGKTALTVAREKGYTEIVELLKDVKNKYPGDILLVDGTTLNNCHLWDHNPGPIGSGWNEEEVGFCKTLESATKHETNRDRKFQYTQIKRIDVLPLTPAEEDVVSKMYSYDRDKLIKCNITFQDRSSVKDVFLLPHYFMYECANEKGKITRSTVKAVVFHASE